MSGLGTSEPATGEIGVNLYPEINIIGGSTPGVPGPTIVAVAQYGNVVAVRTQLSPIQLIEEVAVSLFRSLTTSGPWIELDATQVDPYNLTTDLIDASPLFGLGVYYAAAASTIGNSTSDLSAPVLYSASQVAAT